MLCPTSIDFLALKRQQQLQQQQQQEYQDRHEKRHDIRHDLTTIQALLHGTVICTAKYTPIHFGQGTDYAAVALHPNYPAFLRMSSKHMWPDVDRNLYQQFDIEENNDARQKTISENEERGIHSNIRCFTKFTSHRPCNNCNFETIAVKF
jgi:hypothetical protein